MRINKKVIACLLFASLGISGFIFKTALADGGIMIWPPSIHVTQTDQNAIVAWNGTQELLVLSTNFTKPADAQAATLLHVVPLPNNPADIKEEDPGVFDKMVALLNEKIAAMQAKNLNTGWGSGGTANSAAQAAAPSVEVVLQKTIGAHDITVVKVNVADDFSNWIDGFASGKNLAQKQISQTFKDGLQSYLKRGINYFAFDVLDLTDQSTTVKPLVYQFDTKYFYFPLLISGISEIGDSQTNINLFLVFSKDWKLPTDIWQNYGNNYYIDDSRLDIGLTNDELKGISARTAGLFTGDVKVRRFSMRGTLSNINKDLMLFPRLFSSNLKIGMRNDDVKILQQLLINEGFWNSNAGVSSYFGQITKQAVMLFQQKNSEQILIPLGLAAPTGFFGPYTRNYLNNNIFIDFGTGASTILCGNGRCDASIGETATSCPADCGNISANCLKEGQGTMPNPTETQCCSGLAFILGNVSYANGSCMINPSGYQVCANCGNGICGTGENKCNCPQDCGNSSDSGKSQCVASGGSWVWTDCGGCGVPATRAARLNQTPGACPAVCMPKYVCQCSSGSYWGSLEEGCISNTAAVCGNGTCETGETNTGCPQDCGSTVNCVKEGEAFGGGPAATYGTPVRQCCAGLTAMNQNSGIIADGTCGGVGADMPSICTNCGNGICDKGENKCTCPADCKTISAPTCGQWCQKAGFGSGYCKPWNRTTTWAITNNTVDGQATCSSDYFSGQYTSDCGSNNGCCCKYSAATISIPSTSKFVCGNGVCEIGESLSSCPRDCLQNATKNCSIDSDCISDGLTCHTCYNKQSWLSLDPQQRNFHACDGIGDSLCKCQNNVCTVTSVCGNRVCDVGKGETPANCPQDCYSQADAPAKCKSTGGSWNAVSATCACPGGYIWLSSGGCAAGEG